MKISTWVKGGLVSTMLMLGTGSALATESGFYVGLNLGQATYDIEDSVEELIGTTEGLNDSDTAWSLAFGYRFVPFFGIEAAYLDMGEATLQGAGRENFGGGVSYEYAYSGSVSVSGPSLALVAAIPMGGFEMNAKLGFLSAKTEYQESFSEAFYVSGFPPDRYSDSYSESASTTETMYGLGAGYTFGDHFHIRFDWLMIPDAGDEEETGEDDLSALTVGFQYRF